METQATGGLAVGGSFTQSFTNRSGGNGQQNAAGSSAQAVAGPTHETDDGEYWVVSHGESPGIYRGQ